MSLFIVWNFKWRKESIVSLQGALSTVMCLLGAKLVEHKINVLHYNMLCVIEELLPLC